ncbi:MAG: DUF2330 domain-containing protein [bacterium]
MSVPKSILGSVLTVAALSMIPMSASAFCGFYVGGAGAEMFADATQVVLLRDGTTTVLSMQNRYDGPAEGFAMVVPVPVVLQEGNVKTLDNQLFNTIDTLTSPRLVEYWEQDPCTPQYEYDFAASPQAGNVNNSTNEDPGTVTVEAQFSVGEYDIVILSTDQGTALDSWLSTNNYSVPPAAAPYYQPYVNAGMYFFVAKVDPTKVAFDANGKAVLSPLRFNYTSPEFSLPIRLGMINSNGQQDLIVNILARNQRYEVANYPNVFVPTNIEVVDAVRNDFASFYKSLFARTLKENPGSAITEYSWNAGSCDPCPGPSHCSQKTSETLGGDVINAGDQGYWDFVITRLHLRYDKDEVGEDLVFKKADPVVGGREMRNENGELEEGALPSSQNNFQARYIIRHRWEGEVLCADPIYEQWGGDPSNPNQWGPAVTPAPGPNTTGDDAFATSGVNANRPVEELVREDIPEIGVVAAVGSKSGGGACTSTSGTAIPLGLLALGGLMVFGRIRRRRD